MRIAIRAIVTNENKMLVMKRNKFGKQYYTLIGGGVDMGEGLESALRRELHEEAGLEVGRVQLIFIEDPGEPYGVQYVFWCEYKGGEPKLSETAAEYEISKAGLNTYEPMWLPIAELPNVNFVSGSLKQALIRSFQVGFPSEPTQLDWQADRTLG